MNQIMEVLEQKGNKQTWLAKKTWENLQSGKRLCSKPTTTTLVILDGNSRNFKH